MSRTDQVDLDFFKFDAQNWGVKMQMGERQPTDRQPQSATQQATTAPSSAYQHPILKFYHKQDAETAN